MLGRLFRAVVIPALAAGMTLSSVSVAAAQEADPNAAIPSVGVTPVGTTPDDPNGGQWFVAAPKVGENGEYEPVRLEARIVNPAPVPQTVKLYMADVTFSADGSPQLEADSQQEVGAWGGFEQSSVTIEPRSSVHVPFTVRAPKNAEPGDHIGAVIAESAPEQASQGNLLSLVKRVAVRLYVTIPGEASPNFVIEKIDVKPDSSFFPREADIVVTLRNTGRVRLQPTVVIDGKPAKGSGVLLSQSIEEYTVTSKVPLWGGPQKYKVSVASRIGTGNSPGPFRQATASRFYFPWVLLVGLVVVAGLVFGVRRSLRRRGGKYAEMRADMRRIERLLAEQRAGAPIDTKEDDPEVALKAAIKRAGRAGDAESEEKLKAKLAEHRAAMSDVAKEAAPEPEPVVAIAPQPEPEPEPVVHHDEPAPAAAGSSTYDWLLDDSPAEPVVAAEDPKDFYDSLRDAPEPSEPPRTSVQSAMGPGYFVPDPAPPAASPPMPDVALEPEPEPVVATAPQPEPEPAPEPAPMAAPPPASDHVDALADVLRELKTAPKKKQEALLQQARSYGVLTLRAHTELIDELPADVKVKLLPKQWAI